MNEIVNKFLLTGDKFMREMHLRHKVKCIYIKCLRIIYKKWFTIYYEDFKDLTRRAGSDKVFCNKACNIVKNPKYDRYQSFNGLLIFW